MSRSKIAARCRQHAESVASPPRLVGVQQGVESFAEAWQNRAVGAQRARTLRRRGEKVWNSGEKVWSNPGSRFWVVEL